MPSIVGTPTSFHATVVTSFSHSVTLDASCEKLLVFVAHGQATNSVTHSNVAFNGDAMSIITWPGSITHIDSQVTQPTRRRFSVWELDAPDTGSAFNVTGDFSASVAGYTVAVVQVDSLNSTLTLGTPVVSAATSSSLAIGITPAAADSLILVAFMTNSGASAPFTVANSTDTEIIDQDANNHGFFVGYGDVVSAGVSQTMGATASTDDEYGAIVIEILAAGGTTHEGTAALSITVSTSQTGSRTAVGTAALNAAITLAATGLPTHKGAAALAVAVTLASTGVNLSTTKTGDAALTIAITVGDITTLRTAVGVAALQSTVTLGNITTLHTGVGTGALGITITIAAEGVRDADIDYPYAGPYWAGGIPEFLREKAKKFWKDTKNKHVPDREV